MEFQLMSAKYWMDYERLLKDYPQIAEEFKVQIVDTSVYDSDGRCHKDSEVYIIINTLEDLMKLIKMVDETVLINEDEIIIYDDYIE